jgi:hypothetical protein
LPDGGLGVSLLSMALGDGAECLVTREVTSWLVAVDMMDGPTSLL